MVNVMVVDVFLSRLRKVAKTMVAKRIPHRVIAAYFNVPKATIDNWLQERHPPKEITVRALVPALKRLEKRVNRKNTKNGKHPTRTPDKRARHPRRAD